MDVEDKLGYLVKKSDVAIPASNSNTNSSSFLVNNPKLTRILATFEIISKVARIRVSFGSLTRKLLEFVYISFRMVLEIVQ